MKNMALGSFILLLVFSSTSALAWGQREQDALKGLVAGVLIYKHIEHFRSKDKQVRVKSRRSTYADCITNPYCDNPRAAAAYERGQEQRRREIQAKIEDEAYRRGYREY